MRDFRSARFNTALLLAILALLAVGLLAIFSASHIANGAEKVLKQGLFALVGLAGMSAMAWIDYRGWSRYWRVLVVLTIAALVATLFLAREINGARSWIDLGAFRLQPSELAKLALILAFAALLARLGPEVRTLPAFLRCILLFAVPILLVLRQPDLGTAMVLCAIWLVMITMAGARGWMLLGFCGLVLLLFGAAWQFGLIQDYQKKRLNFINAMRTDPAGAGYHQRQARIAIGAGELFGKGYLRGTQAQRGFLPEQDTDFIFAVIGEEFGFVGALLLLGLYLFVLIRLLRIAEDADTPFGRHVAIGVAAMLAIHIIINVGMSLALSPVTGVPLPLVSYGGSNLLTNLLALGIIFNISRHRLTRRTWAGNDALIRL